MGWLHHYLLGDFSWGRLLRSAVLIYVIVAAYVYLRADAMIFHPPPPTYDLSADIRVIPMEGGDRLAVLYLPNPEASFTLLYSHGNAEDLGIIQPLLRRYHDWGFSVLAYDYRGYGLSTGTPTEVNAYGDVRAAYEYLTQTLNVPPQQIILYGRSLGGGVATELATQVPVAGLILESTFTSAFRVVVPFPLFPFDKFNTQAKLRRLQIPILILHGTADNVVPFGHGQQLFATAGSPKFSLWVEGAGHNDFSDVAGDRHRQALQNFSRKLQDLPTHE